MRFLRLWGRKRLRGRMDAPGRSDSSAQVLRNSRPEFRLPGATRHGSYQIEHYFSDVDCFPGKDAQFRFLGACVTIFSSDNVSWPVGSGAQRANCEAPERTGTDRRRLP